MRRIVLLVVTALITAMAIPAYAGPANGNGNKVVNEDSLLYDRMRRSGGLGVL